MTKNIIIKGNIWESNAQLICVTTNGTVSNHRLVMGRGIALEAKNKYPDLPRYAASQIEQNYNQSKELSNGVYLYGFLPVMFPNPENKPIGLFQTKLHWLNNSTLSLLGYSVWQLNIYLQSTDPKSIALNFPGIGLGGLDREDVLLVLEELDDRVILYEK